MRVHTRFFGDMECPREAVIRFPDGIQPFPDTDFVVISKPEDAVIYLQSTNCEGLCFIAVPVQVVEPAYFHQIPPWFLDSIGARPDQANGQGLTSLAILTVPGEGPITANMLAPVVINPATNKGVQAVRTDQRYSHAHPVKECLPC